MMILWLVVGCVLVTIGFILPGTSVELWPSINGAGIVALIYLVSLLYFILRTSFSTKQRIAVVCIAVITVISIASTWSGLYEDSHWRRENLLDIRTIIGRGIIVAMHPGARTLLQNVKEYHSQPKGQHRSLLQIFLKNNPAAAVGKDIRKGSDVPDTMFTVSVAALADTQIVLIATDHVARGIDPSFKNVDGRTGRVQERFVLTEKGVSHDILN